MKSKFGMVCCKMKMDCSHILAFCCIYTEGLDNTYIFGLGELNIDNDKTQQILLF